MFIFGFIFSFVFNYAMLFLVCFITTWLVLKIIKSENPFRIAFLVALVAPVGFIGYILRIDWILVPLIALFIIKKQINYNFKGMMVVMAIWIVIFIPVLLVVKWVVITSFFKAILPPDAYHALMRRR